MILPSFITESAHPGDTVLSIPSKILSTWASGLLSPGGLLCAHKDGCREIKNRIRAESLSRIAFSSKIRERWSPRSLWQHLSGLGIHPLLYPAFQDIAGCKPQGG